MVGSSIVEEGKELVKELADQLGPKDLELLIARGLLKSVQDKPAEKSADKGSK